jgi:hypothetical protein
MVSLLIQLAIAMPFAGGPAPKATVLGKYVEVRTCDIWTAPCFANAEISIAGKQALMAWKVERGSVDGVTLDGLGIVAVVAASDTLGQRQTGSARAVLIVDERANAPQRDALRRLAQQQSGDLIRSVVAVHTAPIEFTTGKCDGGTCARMVAGELARLETRCIDTSHDKACGNEGAYYPPLANTVRVQPAVALEHRFTGNDLNETWTEADRRGAYVGSFYVP